MTLRFLASVAMTLSACGGGAGPLATGDAMAAERSPVAPGRDNPGTTRDPPPETRDTPTSETAIANTPTTAVPGLVPSPGGAGDGG